MVILRFTIGYSQFSSHTHHKELSAELVILNSLVSESPDCKNGTRTMLHHPLGDAADENMGQARAPMSRNHNEARLNSFGRIDDCLVRDTSLDDRPAIYSMCTQA
jgi:hypothetical protein